MTRKLGRLALLLALGAGTASNVATAQTATPFYIVGVTYPPTVVNNGAMGALIVTWAGSPTFPVRVEYRPEPGWACMRETESGCAAARGAFSAPTNPLILPDAVWCRGSSRTKSAFYKYQVVLIDAKGVTTPAFAAPFTCTLS